MQTYRGTVALTLTWLTVATVMSYSTRPSSVATPGALPPSEESLPELGIVVQVDVELGAHGGVFVAGSVNTVCLGVVADLGLISGTVVPVHLAVCFLAVGNLDEVLQLAAVALGGGVDAVLANGVVGTAHDVGGRDGLEASSVLVGVGDGTVIVHLVEGLRADAVDGGGVQHCLIVGMIGNHSVVSGLLKILCSECSDRRHAAGGHCHAQNGRGNALITFH